LVLTRTKQLLIELHEKGIPELQRHQVSGTCSTTTDVINAYTLPRDTKVKKLLATHRHTQYNITTDFNSSSQSYYYVWATVAIICFNSIKLFPLQLRE